MGLQNNITSLIFDTDVLHKLIQSIITEYGIYFQLEEDNLNKWPMLFKYQHHIREKFDESYKQGIIKCNSGHDKNVLGLPDYFALFMLLLFHNEIQNINSWDELKLKLNRNNLKLSYHPSKLDSITQCACSHGITEIHTLSNYDSNMFILVGCVCVEKQLLKGKKSKLSESVKKCKKEKRIHKKYLKELEIKNKIIEKQQEYINKYHWNLDVLMNKMRQDGIPIPCLIRI